MKKINISKKSTNQIQDDISSIKGKKNKIINNNIITAPNNLKKVEIS